MTELEVKIFNHYQTEKYYYYSSASADKSTEIEAIKNLEFNGYIIVKMRTIGYVIAETV